MISSDCGMALEIQSDDIESDKAFLEAQNCKITGAYEI